MIVSCQEMQVIVTVRMQRDRQFKVKATHWWSLHVSFPSLDTLGNGEGVTNITES